MEKLINIQIEKLYENGESYYLATSEDVKGLLAEGKSIKEVLEIAEDIAKIILEAN